MALLDSCSSPDRIGRLLQLGPSSVANALRHTPADAAIWVRASAQDGGTSVIVDDEGRPTSLLDVRLVMLHLIKVFAELETERVSPSDGEWIDIGGG